MAQDGPGILSFPTLRKEEETGMWPVLRLLTVEAEQGK